MGHIHNICQMTEITVYLFVFFWFLNFVSFLLLKVQFLSSIFIFDVVSFVQFFSIVLRAVVFYEISISLLFGTSR